MNIMKALEFLPLEANNSIQGRKCLQLSKDTQLNSLACSLSTSLKLQYTGVVVDHAKLRTETIE